MGKGKDELTRRVDALYHRGLSWPLARDLQQYEDLDLVTRIEEMTDRELWMLVRLPRRDDGGYDAPMTDLRDLSDAELATRRFNQKERFRLLQDGMPLEAIRILRQGYVEAVLGNPEALRQLRVQFGITARGGPEVP